MLRAERRKNSKNITLRALSQHFRYGPCLSPRFCRRQYVVTMLRRRLGTNEARRGGLRVSHPNCWLIPSKTRHLAPREAAFVYKEYTNYT